MFKYINGSQIQVTLTERSEVYIDLQYLSIEQIIVSFSSAYLVSTMTIFPQLLKFNFSRVSSYKFIRNKTCHKVGQSQSRIYIGTNLSSRFHIKAKDQWHFGFSEEYF